MVVYVFCVVVGTIKECQMWEWEPCLEPGCSERIKGEGFGIVENGGKWRVVVYLSGEWKAKDFTFDDKQKVRDSAELNLKEEKASGLA